MSIHRYTNVYTITTASFVNIMYTGNPLFVDPLRHLSAVENWFYTIRMWFYTLLKLHTAH